MKSNYQSTPTERLENRRPKCTHKKDSLHVFFCILQLIYKENRNDGFSKPNRNGTEIEKFIQHIPSLIHTSETT